MSESSCHHFCHHVISSSTRIYVSEAPTYIPTQRTSSISTAFSARCARPTQCNHIAQPPVTSACAAPTLPSPPAPSTCAATAIFCYFVTLLLCYCPAPALAPSLPCQIFFPDYVNCTAQSSDGGLPRVHQDVQPGQLQQETENASYDQSACALSCDCTEQPAQSSHM